MLAELLHVVGEQPEPQAARLELADLVHDHPVHAGCALTPEASVRLHVDLGTEDRGRALRQPGEVGRDVDLALLEQVPVGFVADVAGGFRGVGVFRHCVGNRGGDGPAFDPDVVRLAEQELEQRALGVALRLLERADADEEWARDDAAEVEDNGADHWGECSGYAERPGSGCRDPAAR